MAPDAVCDPRPGPTARRFSQLVACAEEQRVWQKRAMPHGLTSGTSVPVLALRVPARIARQPRLPVVQVHLPACPLPRKAVCASHRRRRWTRVKDLPHHTQPGVRTRVAQGWRHDVFSGVTCDGLQAPRHARPVAALIISPSTREPQPRR